MNYTQSVKWHLPLAVLILILLFSCNPYKQIVKHPPLTHKDSVRLALVCVRVYPNDTTSATTTTIIINGADSSAYFKDKADSLAAIKMNMRDSIIKRYKDTCKSIVTHSENVCDVCYQQGYYLGRENAIHDTAFITTNNYITDTKKLKLEQDKAIQAQHKSDVNSLWKKIFMGIAGVLLVLCLLLFFINKKK